MSSYQTVKSLKRWNNVYVDVDAQGEPIGFEILRADSSLLARLPHFPQSAALRDLIGQSAA